MQFIFVVVYRCLENEFKNNQGVGDVNRRASCILTFALYCFALIE